MSFSQIRNGRGKRIVIKLGTGLLTCSDGSVRTDLLEEIAQQIKVLRGQGWQVLIVSSGAVGLGLRTLGLQKRPKEVSKLQASAAIGQSRLMQLWQSALATVGLAPAQVLLTHDDLRSRPRYITLKETLSILLERGIIPVINENDAISAEEIRFGDNDALAALVASQLDVQLLFLLSTIPGLLNRFPDGEVVPVVETWNAEIEALAHDTQSPTSVGGMVSKLKAARLACRSGCGVYIALGSQPGIVTELLAGRGVGTFFLPDSLPLDARKRWLAFCQRPHGSVVVDANAASALQARGGSVLAIGVVEVRGHFRAGEVIDVLAPGDHVVARGKVAFSREEVEIMVRKPSADLQKIYPGRRRLEVIHRNDLVLL